MHGRALFPLKLLKQTPMHLKHCGAAFFCRIKYAGTRAVFLAERGSLSHVRERGGQAYSPGFREMRR